MNTPARAVRRALVLGLAVALGLTDTQKSLVDKARRARQLRLESGGGGDEGAWSPDESADTQSAIDALFT